MTVVYSIDDEIVFWQFLFYRCAHGVIGVLVGAGATDGHDDADARVEGE